MSQDKPIVEIRGLTKQFRKKIAIEAVDWDIMPNRIVGLLGANGAGKSTLIRHIIGLYLPTTGTCTTFGCRAEKLGPEQMARIGYVHQEGALLDWMTAGQLIRYVAAYYPHWNQDLEARYIEDFDIDLKSRVRTLSPGQRQKLAILLAIGHEPDLLILDEPASALDPLARSQFLDWLLQIIQHEGRTILISSHILSDVEKVIDQVTIMNRAQLVTDCALDDLREQYCDVRLTSLNGVLPEPLPFEHVVASKQDKGQAVLTLKNTPPDLIQQIARQINCRAEIQPLCLEDLYKLEVA
ncbi:MAG: ATP-binding cassette domain-containing protein [Phycisphaerae bacterium]|nr:ATP-binding cassette domain-containing protein [Phycisphaerae bacterium]